MDTSETFRPAATRRLMAAQTERAPGSVKCLLSRRATACAAICPCVMTRPSSHCSVSGTDRGFSPGMTLGLHAHPCCQYGQRSVVQGARQARGRGVAHRPADGKPLNQRLVLAFGAAKPRRRPAIPACDVNPVRPAVDADDYRRVIRIHPFKHPLHPSRPPFRRPSGGTTPPVWPSSCLPSCPSSCPQGCVFWLSDRPLCG